MHIRTHARLLMIIAFIQAFKRRNWTRCFRWKRNFASRNRSVSVGAPHFGSAMKGLLQCKWDCLWPLASVMNVPCQLSCHQFQLHFPVVSTAPYYYFLCVPFDDLTFDRTAHFLSWTDPRPCCRRLMMISLSNKRSRKGKGLP